MAVPVPQAPPEPRPLRLTDLREDPGLYRILLEHASRGIRVQFMLRFALAAFVIAVVVAVPPSRYRVACYVVAGAYAAWTLVIAWAARRGDEIVIRRIWMALLVDVAVLVVLCVLASRSPQSWTTDILVNGFFVIPMLGTTQLRPEIGAAITAPTVAAYAGSEIAARHANAEPWSGIIISTAVLAALSIGCVLMSWVQRSRVLTIAGLVTDRARLSGELVEVERTARRDLAEELHDGALQYVLAARQDLEDARETDDPESFERIELALRESTALLRSKVSQLHPSVLQTTGLRPALEDLADGARARGHLTVQIHAEHWDDAWRGPAQEIVYSAARELLTNIVKHAEAHAVEITLANADGWIDLTIADDGKGFAEGVADRRLAEGHIGLASQRIRIESAGGSLSLRSGSQGTVAELRLPLEAGGAELAAPTVTQT
jgi:two-component system, NarL family, sensor kinase